MSGNPEHSGPAPAPEPVLPGVLAEIAAAAGREVALKLALALGGQRLYIARPPHLGPDHLLCTAVGAAASRRIAQRFAGETIEIPYARRALARYLSEQGYSTAKIAARLKILRRTARRYVNSAEESSGGP
ncbi:MAG: hypothetical protein OXH64_11035 [Rhodospirillaceae bacterium]|nr:hypothetical protein [Rhodospirillaceae bacterium]